MGENKDLAGISSTNLDLFQPENGNDDALLLEGNLTSAGPELGGNGLSSTSDKSSAAHFNTLDEPISDTIWRDVRAVGLKFKHVLYPVEKKSLLKEWDLWGPLILCTFMATILQNHIDEDDHTHGKKGSGGDGGPEFAEVFVIVWVGALVVTLNTKLLGGHISFFQSVCVLGYCLLPLGMALAICRYANLYITMIFSYLSTLNKMKSFKLIYILMCQIFRFRIVLMAGSQTTVLFILRCISVLIGFVWSVYAAMQFLGDCQPPKRKALAAYPMGLFYFVISWLVVSHN